VVIIIVLRLSDHGGFFVDVFVTVFRTYFVHFALSGRGCWRFLQQSK
jgi:hypothetical protein